MNAKDNNSEAPRRTRIFQCTKVSAAVALAWGVAATPSYAAFTQTSPSDTQTTTIAGSTCRQQLDNVIIGLHSAAYIADGVGLAMEAVGAVFIISEIPGIIAQGVALGMDIAAYAFEEDANNQLPYCEETFAGSVVVTDGGTSVTGDSIFNNNLDVTGALGVNGGATITGGATISSNNGNSLVVDDVSARIQGADGTDFVATSMSSGVTMNGNDATATLNGTSASLLNSTGHGLTITDTYTKLSGGTNSSNLYLMDNRAYLGVGTATEAEVILIDATNSGGGITGVTIGTATAGHTNNLVGGTNNIGTTVAGSVNTIGNAGTSANTLTGATNVITGTVSNTISTGANSVITDSNSVRLENGANNVTVNGSGVAASGNGGTLNIDGNNVSLLNNVADSSLGLSGHGLNITSTQTTLSGGTRSSTYTLEDGDAGGTTLTVGGSVSGTAMLFSATTNDITTISTVTIGTATTVHTNNIVGANNNIGTTVAGSVNTIGNAGTSVNTLTGTTNDITALSTNTLTAGTNNVLNATQQNQLTGGTGNVITATTGSNTITAAGGDNQVVTSAAGAATGTAIQGTGTTDGVSLTGTSGGQTAMVTLGQDNRYGAGTPVANFSTTGGAPIRVTGVADGIYDYDAVNMSQYNYLKGVVYDTQKFAYSGVASVAAMAGIPDPAPGKRYNFGMGIGQYEGYRAVAAGFKGHVTDNISVTAGAAFSSMANTYNAGVGFSW